MEQVSIEETLSDEPSELEGSSGSYSELFFSTPLRTGLLQQLSHLAFFGDGISVVSGEEGSGKTTMLDELQGSFQIVPHISRINLSSSFEIGSFLCEMAEGFGVAVEEDISIGELLMQLRRFSQQLSQDGKLALLLVDDAQYLCDQSLGALMSLLQGESRSGVGIRTILFSDSSLVSRIDELQLVDIPVYDFEVPALSSDELAGFLAFYADKFEKVLPEGESIEHIWSVSQGYPAEALTFMVDESELDAEGEEDEESDFPWLHVGAVITLIVLLAGAYWWQGTESEPIKLKVENGLEKQGSTTDKKPLAEGVSNSDKVTSHEESVSGDDFSVEEPLEGIVDETEKAIISSTLAEADPENVLQQRAVSVEQKDVAQEEVAPEKVTLEEPVVAIEEVQVDVGLEVVGAGALDMGTLKQGVTESSSEFEEPDFELPSVSEAKGNPSPKLDPITKDESFLLSLPPQSYVLQVVAASQGKTLRQYIDKQKNDRLYLYQGIRQGKTWFIVVEGPYKGKAEALSARKSLPEVLRKAGPWPRKLEDIQKEIDLVHK